MLTEASARYTRLSKNLREIRGRKESCQALTNHTLKILGRGSFLRTKRLSFYLQSGSVPWGLKQSFNLGFSVCQVRR